MIGSNKNNYSLEKEIDNSSSLETSHVVKFFFLLMALKSVEIKLEIGRKGVVRKYLKFT